MTSEKYSPGHHLTIDMFQKPYTPKTLSKDSLSEYFRSRLAHPENDDHAYLSKHMLHRPLTPSLHHQTLPDKPSVFPASSKPDLAAFTRQQPISETEPADIQLVYYMTRCRDLTELLTTWENDRAHYNTQRIQDEVDR